MLAAIAIDDEPIALEVIKKLSSRIPFIELRASFTDAFKAVEFLQQEVIDLLFLDIKMPDISGIELLKSLTNPPMIIFTTAYSEHAVQGFELNAVDYLLKPFSAARFLKACQKALEQFELRKENRIPVEAKPVFIKSGQDQVRVDLDKILYAESNGNYIKFILENQTILSRLTMSETEALLPSTAFIRIHRSYIVSIKKISKIEKRSIWISQTQLPIGAGYLHEVEKLFK
jgi:two-component system, LytTR family, response regulator